VLERSFWKISHRTIARAFSIHPGREHPVITNRTLLMVAGIAIIITAVTGNPGNRDKSVPPRKKTGE
jgi:hypothetical protein